VLDPVACAAIKESLEPMLDQFKPPFISKMGFQRITLGELPVVLEGIRVCPAPAQRRAAGGGTVGCAPAPAGPRGGGGDGSGEEGEAGEDEGGGAVAAADGVGWRGPVQLATTGGVVAGGRDTGGAAGGAEAAGAAAGGAEAEAVELPERIEMEGGGPGAGWRRTGCVQEL
jgi:hypothetical protein